MKPETISILGCGWLGLPLGQVLMNEGFELKGSVTTPSKLNELRDTGISPYRLVLHPGSVEMDDPSFFETDLVIVSIPPRRVPDIEEVFPAQIRQLTGLLEAHGVGRVLFISSTSVYAETEGTATETDELLPDKPSGRALVAAENMLLANPAFKTTVLRFGGLIGADRNPARFLSRKREALSGSKPVNLIHRDDCIGIIREIIRQEVWGEVFNACCPEHPTRNAFYEKAAVVSGLPAPEFTDEPEPYKMVDSTKLVRQLNYRFLYHSPMDYLKQLAGM
ncbi:MAG: SDR family oxidoreductase [Mangrovibacterium sp.]